MRATHSSQASSTEAPADQRLPPGRHFGMDWLRIAAFQLLIFYHIGMTFVPWDYPVKVVRPIDWVTIPMLLTNPWRLSLLFVVSGYASAALFNRGERRVGLFLSSRLARLGLPLAFGMIVIVTPQPWVWLVTHAAYPLSFSWFLTHDYYRPHVVHGVAMPTWMHLWFVAYLLIYTLGLCALLTTPLRWRMALRRSSETLLGRWGLLPLPIAYVYAARHFLSPGWEDSHRLFDDWSAHAVYLPMFLFGYSLRSSTRLQATVTGKWKLAAVVALAGWAVLAVLEVRWPGNTPLPKELWPVSGLARAAEGWAAVVALLGLADRYLNSDNRWHSVLVDAVFPFYLIHQTIIILVAFWLQPLGLSATSAFLLLVSSTMAGCWLFYLLGREVSWMRPLIGLKPHRSR